MKKSAEGQRSVLKEVANATRFIASMGLIIGGGYAGWVAPNETPLARECNNLRIQVENLQDELLNKGTLSYGDRLFSGLEIRNPDDPSSVKMWVELKNRRDRACAEDYKQDRESFSSWARILAGAGLVSILFYFAPKRR